MFDMLPSEELQGYLDLPSHEDVISLLRMLVGLEYKLQSCGLWKAAHLLVNSPKPKPEDCGYMQKAVYEALEKPDQIESVRFLVARLNELLNQEKT